MENIIKQKQIKSQMVENALYYAEKYKWKVFPVHSICDGICTCRDPNCESAGKHPRTAHGLNEATADREQIKKWWNKWPEANIGVATGRASGFFVVDIDGIEGEENMRDFINQYGAFPETVEQRTGKGKHIFFNAGNVKIPNKVRVVPKIDVRGDGGYIVVSPSMHITGKKYEWIKSPDEIAIAEAPKWLLELLVEKTGVVKIKNTDWNREIWEGERNETLTSIAGSLIAKNIPPETVFEFISVINQKYCKPEPLPEAEIKKLVSSVHKIHTRKKLTVVKEKTFNMTDLGNAQRLVYHYGENIRHCHPWKKWLVWSGKHWKLDDTAEIMKLAKKTTLNILAEAEKKWDDRERKELVKFEMKSEQRDRLKAMVELASSEEGVPVLPEHFDKNIYFLNVKNGTIDLKTGELLSHRREDLLTKLIPVDYNKEATCERWEQFLAEIMDGNQNLIQFIQRAVGMSITGDVSEQILFVLWGSGRNGKSTLLNTILYIIGDYGRQLPQGILMYKSTDRHPTEIVELFGKRLVVTTESEQGHILDESKVKYLSGGDIILARRMREDYWAFVPTHKIWLVTNHKPRIRGTDLAIWRRIKLIPFQVVIAEEKQDKHLMEKLLAEKEGILKWMVDGCLKWQQEGIGIPEEVKNATEEYRREQDTLADFFTEKCIIEKNLDVKAKELFNAYIRWCEETKEKPTNQKRFGLQLAERGFEKKRTREGYFWQGIGLQDE